MHFIKFIIYINKFNYFIYKINFLEMYFILLKYCDVHAVGQQSQQRKDLKPGLTDRLVVGRNVTLTLTSQSRGETKGWFADGWQLPGCDVLGFLPSS
jgi:hypothetical protein